LKLAEYLKKSVGTGFVNVAGSAIVSASFIPLLIYRMGLDLYGKWMLIFLFSGFATVIDLGVSKSMVGLLPKSSDANDRNSIFSAGLLFCCCLVLVVFFLGLIAGLLKIEIWGGSESLSSHEGRLLFFAATFLVAISLLTNFSRSLLEAFFKIYLVNIGFLLLTVLNYVSVYILTFFSIKLENIVLCTVCVYLAVFFFHVVALISSCELKIVKPSISICKMVGRSSLQFMSIGVLTSVINPMNRYLLIFFSGDAGVYGAFDVALKLAMMANSLLSLFATPLFSVFSSFGFKQLSDIKRVAGKITLLLLGGYLFGNIIFMLFGSEILTFVIHQEYNSLYSAAMVLMLGICLTGVTEAYYRAFLGLGDLRIPFMIKSGMLIINLAMIFFLSHMPPLMRVSLSLSLAYGFSSLMLPILFKVKFGS